MKKKIITMFSLMLCLLLCISLVACNKNKHEANSEWKSDETKHWHECTTKGHDDKLDEADHTWNDGEVKTQPTETAEGVKTFTCTVCGRTKTEPLAQLEHTHKFANEWSKDETNHWHAATCEHTGEKNDLAAHTYGNWTVKTAEGVHVDRVEQRECSVCQHTEERTIANTQEHEYDYENIKSDATDHWFECSCGEKTEIEAHTYGAWSEKTPAGIHVDRVEQRKCSVCQHTEERTIINTQEHEYDYENIKSDATDHWFECSCGEKTEIEAHTYSAWSEKTPAGEDQDKQYSRKCSKCEYEEVLTFDNTKTNGSYCVAITSTFVVNGKKMAGVQVVRGTICTGDNIEIDGVEGTFLIEEITENGKTLESASCGQSVYLELVEESGDWSLISNSTILAYEPETVKSYSTFTAQITIDKSNFNGNLTSGREVLLDLYNVDYGMSPYALVLPEGVKVAEDGESYVVSVTLWKNTSRALWVGMEFSCKISVTTESASSHVIVARGIILSVAD